MKKLLTALLSVLMVLGICVSVGAAAGPGWNIEYSTNVPGKETSSVISNYAAYVSEERTINITAKSVDGYTFSYWTATVYDGTVENINSYFGSTTSQSTTFTVPAAQDPYDGRIVITANFRSNQTADNVTTDGATVEAEGNVKKVENVDKIAQAIEATGVEVKEGDTIKIDAVTEAATVTEEDKSAAEATATQAGGTFVAVEEQTIDYKYVATITRADGTTVSTQPGQLPDLMGGALETEVPSKTDASLLTAPDGFTRNWFAIVKEDNGEINVWPVTNITADSIKFLAEKNSVLTGKFYKDVENPKGPAKAGKKDTNSDGIVDCVEENGKGWVWSQSKNVCVYKVTNTGAR